MRSKPRFFEVGTFALLCVIFMECSRSLRPPSPVVRARCSRPGTCPQPEMACRNGYCYSECSASQRSCEPGQSCTRLDVGCECGAHMVLAPEYVCMTPKEIMEARSEASTVYTFQGNRWARVESKSPMHGMSHSHDKSGCGTCPSETHCLASPEGSSPRCLRRCSWDGDCKDDEYCECNTEGGGLTLLFGCLKDDEKHSKRTENTAQRARLRPHDPAWCSLQ
jgi:hypothetical protein